MNVEGDLPTGSAPFQVGILLQRDSLSLAFLTFSSPPSSTISTLFAMDCSFSSTTMIGATVQITFSGFPRNCIIFQCRPILEARTLRTRIAYFSRIGVPRAAVFAAAKAAFVAARGFSLSDLRSPAPVLPLLPIVSDARSADTRRRRCDALNLPFLTRAAPLTVHFLTWIRPLSFLFSSKADLVVVTLQAMYFSVWALFVGTSPQVQRRSRQFDDAGHSHGSISVSEASLGCVLLKVMKSGAFPYSLTAEMINSIRLGANCLACNKSAVSGGHIGQIAAHLSASVENERARPAQVEQLVRAFGDGRQDFLVLIGDLNYRVESDIASAVRLIESGELQQLLAADGLSRLLAAHAPAFAFAFAFAGFAEPPIAFGPTFCFDAGSDEYDSSAKHGVPAWTDGILVRTEAMREAIGPADEVVSGTDGLAAVWAGEAPKVVPDAAASWPAVRSFSRYDADPIRQSDHRPVAVAVAAAVEFRVPVVVEERRREGESLSGSWRGGRTSLRTASLR
jgi:hypothetical protein